MKFTANKEQIINQLKPEKPIYCIRKNSIRSAVKYFNKNFPGKILYAVKTNPHPAVIQTIIDSGVEQFDVASIEEIKNIRNFSQTAKCSYMHTDLVYACPDAVVHMYIGVLRTCVYMLIYWRDGLHVDKSVVLSPNI